MQTRSIDTPLSEIVLRRYEKPLGLKRRELVRKLCLGLGLLNPGDSRDVVVDVLCVLLYARRGEKKLSSDEIREETISLRRQEGLDDRGTAASNIRRQIRRLKALFLVEKLKNDYRITENARLADLFSEKIEKIMLPSILSRIRDYMEALDQEFGE